MKINNAPNFWPDGSPVSGEWKSLFEQLCRVAQAMVSRGPTAQRPTEGLWIGRPYYDETLNYEVHVDSLNPTVWRNAAGVDVT